MDLKFPLNVNFDDLTDDEKDEIASSLPKENLDKSNDISQLKSCVKLLQKCLGFKVEQVINLGLELDELASKQGAEEAQLIQEINNLKAQLDESSLKSIKNVTEIDSEEDIRRLLHVSELNAQQLLAEVQAQEQEQLSNKIEIEKLESQLAAVESDRLQLQRELSALKEEIHDQQKEEETGMLEPLRKEQQLVESLRKKNKHLSHLLNDIEMSEKENIVLREKLTSVKIELAEATKNIMHITGDIVTLQITKEELLEKLHHSEQMCKALTNQIQDLVGEKEKRDAELEAFQQEVDVRIQEWKEIVASKEEELSDLKEQLTHQSLKGQYIMKDCESEQIFLLSQTLQKRESQIDELQSQLSQATKDLTETTSLLENMHRASEISQAGLYPPNVEVTEKQLVATEERIRILEEKLQDAENDAVGKSEEITKLIIQLRSYEAGEFGLSEALAQIKDLSQQKTIRDKHIEQLVETANSLQHTCDCLQEENLTLRERLHISPEEQVLTSAVVLKSKEQNVYKTQQQHIDRLEEDLLSAKMDRRTLSQQILVLKNKIAELEKYPQDTQKPGVRQQSRHQADDRVAARKIRVLQQKQYQLDIEHQTLIEENEALRQGLHDILDSVHHQDGKSNVRLESKILEHLLQALDSRHISGWYHPAMRIQAKVNAVEGSNEALREQLHSMREEELKIQDELQRAKLHIAELEGNIMEAKIPSQTVCEPCSPQLEQNKVSLPFSLPVQLSPEGCDLLSKINNHLLQVLHENEVEKSQVSETVKMQKELQLHLEDLVSHFTLTINQQNIEKLKLEEERSKLEDDVISMEAKLTFAETQVSHLKSLWDTFSSQDEIKREMVRDIYSIVDLLAEKEKYSRIAQSALQFAQNTKKQSKVIRTEWNISKENLIKQIGDLLQFKKVSLLHMTDLQTLLVNSVPLASLIAANKQREEVSIKYNQLLRQFEISENKSSIDLKQLISELELERNEKHDLARRLEDMSKMLSLRKYESNDSSQELSSLLARTEAESLRNKQQAQHAEKMAEIIKTEMKQLSERCSALEEEVLTLLNANEGKMEKNTFLCSGCLFRNKSSDENCSEYQLSKAKAEVMELQASRETLQELANISQAQVQMLDQLHERSELQLDSLRQVLYKLQSENDLKSELVRLTEELCASQVSEMSAWNQISSLEKRNYEILAAKEMQDKEIAELQSKFNMEKQQFLQQFRKMQEEIITLRVNSDMLPLAFFYLVVTAYTQCSAENRNLWQCLLDKNKELATLKTDLEIEKVSCQQSLELQKAIQTAHSDVDCQHQLESWSAEVSELKIKALRSSRQLETLESNLMQAYERLQKRETLLSSLEQQVLLYDIQKKSTIADKDTMGIVPERRRPPTEINIQTTSNILEPKEKESEPKDDVNKMASTPQKEAAVIYQIGDTHEAKSTIKCGEEEHLKQQIRRYQEEVLKLSNCLRDKESELESERNTLRDLQQSLVKNEVPLPRMDQLPDIYDKISERGDIGSTNQEKVALQATVDSLQTIIVQKEDTISRYQKFLQDIREEDGRIISNLQEHLRLQQADLTALEQAYVRLKISMRQLTLNINGENNCKETLNLHLIRSNELEDEVSLLKSKVLTLSSELQQKQQEASYWKSASQQHLGTIEDLNNRLSDCGKGEKRPPPSVSSGGMSMQNPLKSTNLSILPIKTDIEKKNFKRSRVSEGYSKVTESQIQLQVSSEVTELRNKIQQMEEQELKHKNEIQRLKDQIPIYSRRVHQSQAETILPERERELLKKIRTLEQQAERLISDHEKTLLQISQQHAKKIKSAENVARWDEQKKHQIQIERLKSCLQEQTDETALLLDKIDRMHITVHRLEKEKLSLEHQLKSFYQEKAMLEERLKNLESNQITPCLLEDLQQDRDRLLREVQTLKAKDLKVENSQPSSNLRDSQQSKIYTKKKLHKKDITKDKETMELHTSNATERDRANILKANLELECQNLELKLEAEKLRSELPCLRNRVAHLERLLSEVHDHQAVEPSSMTFSDTLEMENKGLHNMVKHLSAQLEAANQRLQSPENISDHTKIAALQTELSQKSLLLGKVKILLERAALKERQLTEQVRRLQAAIGSK
ncbi:Centrosomal protein of 290 kDa [Frankliniella fusca]|uniref:Centrosomal protein of 290 kDa n=1 Tax=Frankliniella fusca TaxID=407009 RepID=A0AAE1HK49_9NEOP|nr:Centrosomal protein of 290 kDa [Frankliniella fusca]